MILYLLLIIIIIFLGGVIYTLKNGFNEVIKALEAINRKIDESEA